MIRLHVFSPLPKMLGVTDDLKTTTLELPVEPQTTLRGLFGQLANRYPSFESLSNPKAGDKLSAVIVSMDGKVVPVADQATAVIPPEAEISLMPPYAGG